MRNVGITFFPIPIWFQQFSLYVLHCNYIFAMSFTIALQKSNDAMLLYMGISFCTIRHKIWANIATQILSNVMVKLLSNSRESKL